MQLLSPDFLNGTCIPERFTCEGENINPNLHIGGVPEATRCLALIMDDPDAPHGTFVHWVIWNIPYNVGEIDAGTLPVGSMEGVNGAGKPGYMGPCPPTGIHRYFFKLYALNTELELAAGATHEMLEYAMRGHIVAQAELVGLYSKDKDEREKANQKQQREAAQDRPGENPPA